MDFKNLENIGFLIKKRNQNEKIVNSRLENLPKTYISFLQNFEEITNSNETTWFNSIEDFNESIEKDFKWNEFEILSKEYCDTEEELKEVEEFWNHYIPIIISVKNDYEFLAIDKTDANFGRIVHGREPEFENVSEYCKDFNELIELFNTQEIIDYWI